MAEKKITNKTTKRSNDDTAAHFTKINSVVKKKAANVAEADQITDNKATPKKSNLTKSSVPNESVVKKQSKKIKDEDKKSVKDKINYDGPSITVQQIASSSGSLKSQIQTLKGLGLNKINRISTLQDTPSINGMIKKVAHLIKVIK